MFEGSDFIISGNTDGKMVFEVGKDDKREFQLKNDFGFQNLRINYNKGYNYNIH